jgi:hypothetical protein
VSSSNLSGDGKVTVKQRLRGTVGHPQRALAVTLFPIEGVLIIAAWAWAGEKFHAYPGEHVAEGFLTPLEHVTLAAGVEELGKACSGRPITQGLIKDAIDCAKVILDWVVTPKLLLVDFQEDDA